MDDQEVYTILKEQGQAATHRLHQVRVMIFITWIYMLVFSVLFIFSQLTLTHSNKDLAEVIERRSPVLEFLDCRANYEDKQIGLNNQQTTLNRNLLVAFIEQNELGTKEAQVAFVTTKREYEIKSAEIVKKLDEPSSCEDIPS